MREEKDHSPTIIRLRKRDIEYILKNTEKGIETTVRITPKYNYLMTLRQKKRQFTHDDSI